MCPLEESYYLQLLDALLMNEGMSAGTRRWLMVIHSDYLRSKGRLEEAIKAITITFEMYPTLEDLQLLVQYYDEGGYTDEIMNTLDIIEELDTLGRLRKFVREYRIKITQ